MDQTKNNLERIRAFDAEEGEWRTINGAHVLIKNGRIAGGAGGALNGQPFRGGSLKKMQSGSKGSKFNENREKASVRGTTSSVFGPIPAGLNEKRLAHIPNNVTTEVPHYDPSRRYTIVQGRPERIGKISSPIKYDVLEGARPIATGSFGTTFEAAHKQVTVPEYARWGAEGTAYMEPSKAELAARARSLKKRRPDLFKAGRGGSTSPQQGAAYNTGKKRALEHIKRLTNEGHEDPEALAAVKAEASSYVKKWRDIAKRNPGDETAEKQLGWYETLEKGWGDMLNSVNRSKSREAERGGTSAPQQSAPHATKLGRMQPGSTAVNAGKEAKRLNHNANVYKRTARLQYAKKSAKLRPQYNEAKMEKEKAHTDWSKANSYLEDRRIRELQRTPENKQHEKHNAYRKLQAKNDARRNIAETAAENQATKIENELNDYHNRLTSNVVNRNIAASNAKSRLARMQQLAKALRKSRPDLFKRR